MRLDGKVAVVTGGAPGIGEAVAIRFREEGARVAVLDLNLEAAKLTADVAGGGHAIATDVSDSAAVDAALGEVEERLGPVDVWVNNAGISGRAHAERVQPRAEQQMNEMATGDGDDGARRADPGSPTRSSSGCWPSTWAARSTGPGRPLARWWPAAPARSSTLRPSAASRAATGHPHYSAAKAGILALHALGGQGTDPAGRARQRGRTGLRRHADDDRRHVRSAARRDRPRYPDPPARPAEEIAAAVAFLASDDASYCVGETISPNGGFTTV